MIRLESYPTLDGLDMKKPAIVIGKGPTTDNLPKVDLDKYNVFTLNHAIKLVDSAFGAHFIDIEALLECSMSVRYNARYLFMPMRPHRNMTAGDNIEDIEEPILSWMDSLERLVTYFKAPLPAEKCKKDIISCRYFSAEAMFGVLGMLGFKAVHTIGIDGGTGYARAFTMKPLTNGRLTFDDQMDQLHKIAKIRGFKWTPLY